MAVITSAARCTNLRTAMARQLITIGLNIPQFAGLTHQRPSRVPRNDQFSSLGTIVMSRQHSHTTDLTNFSRVTDLKTDFLRSDQFEARDSDVPQKSYCLRDPEQGTVLVGASVQISARREMLKRAFHIPATKSIQEGRKEVARLQHCAPMKLMDVDSANKGFGEGEMETEIGEGGKSLSLGTFRRSASRARKHADERDPILELLSGENRVLLVWWDTLFVLYLRLDLENEGQSEGWTPTGCWARMSASSPCSSLSTQEVACLRVKSATQPNPPPSVPSPASVALPDSAASSRNIRIATSLEGLCWAQRLGQLELGCPISAGLRVAASQIDGLRVREAIWVTEKKKKRRQTEIWGWMTRPRRCVLWEWEEEER
ncbi:hypothetical protein BDZ89DRAFT_1045274 [Hymenopellis radicata]|nr:hypothetical protein BDZ89DRAFT_1045274 [Hymenopellis radicata]